LKSTLVILGLSTIALPNMNGLTLKSSKTTCGIGIDMPMPPLAEKRFFHCALPPHYEQHLLDQWLAMLKGHET
jgi:hypothetical protein